MKTIVTNGCLTPKPSKNHEYQWLPQTILFNADGAFENHRKISMVKRLGLDFQQLQEPTKILQHFGVLFLVGHSGIESIIFLFFWSYYSYLLQNGIIAFIRLFRYLNIQNHRLPSYRNLRKPLKNH